VYALASGVASSYLSEG